jgi:hypothetical protein
LTLGTLPLLDRLAQSQRILLMGAGGGFDVLTGVPLFDFLTAQGKQVFLGSLSFSELKKADVDVLGLRARRSLPTLPLPRLSLRNA